MSYTKDHLGGCVELEIKILEEVDIPIGCFYFPNDKELAIDSSEEEKTLGDAIGVVKELLGDAKKLLGDAIGDAKELLGDAIGDAKGLVSKELESMFI